MLADRLARDLYTELSKLPFVDPHSHIDPRSAPARSLDDILGYHYYTELAHSAGMPQDCLAPDVHPKDRVRTILGWLDRIDNTAQYGWFLHICRAFLGFKGDRVTAADTDFLWSQAETRMGQPTWEDQVLRQTNVEKIFLTNDFDDTLEDFDTNRYVPCLRTDDLVFKLDDPKVRERLTKATGVEPTDAGLLRQAIGTLFQHFVRKGAKACAISLPPGFAPTRMEETVLSQGLLDLSRGEATGSIKSVVSWGVFWMLAEHCQEFGLPFDLMIGVNRKVYPGGVFQGQDLFDQRTSLIQYAELFNAFPQVMFPISVLTSSQNQELVSYAWIFPNVIVNGHWWYSNIPTFIQRDLAARLQAVPKTKTIGYYSDAYKLEFILPKFGMFRRLLARTLADDFVRSGACSETQALALGKQVLCDNSKAIFRL